MYFSLFNYIGLASCKSLHFDVLNVTLLLHLELQLKIKKTKVQHLWTVQASKLSGSESETVWLDSRCPHSNVYSLIWWNLRYLADFNLSGGCFGIDIIQKCTKWFQIGVHGLEIGQIFAKFQCASFLVRNYTHKIQQTSNILKYNWNMSFFVKQQSPRSYRRHTQIGKNNLSAIIQLNEIILTKFNLIQLQSV